MGKIKNERRATVAPGHLYRVPYLHLRNTGEDIENTVENGWTGVSVVESDGLRTREILLLAKISHGDRMLTFRSVD